MKRFVLFLVVCNILALSGCVTYKYFDYDETRQIALDEVFKKASSESSFDVADISGSWGIRLAYVDSYDAYDVTRHAAYEVHYRVPTTYVLILYYRGEKEKTGETLIKEWTTEGSRRKNAKTEPQVIAKGQSILLTVPSGQSISFTLDQDGVLPLNESVSTQVLSAIESLEDLAYIKVTCPALGLTQRLDLSAAPSFKAAIASGDELIRSLAAYKVFPSDFSSRYDEAQKSLLSLSSSYRYGYQKRLAKGVFDANYQVVVKALKSQIDSLQVSIPTFIIQGEIRDIGSAWVQIWGTATPRPITAETMRLPGYQNRAANLIVESPDTSGFHGTVYVAMTHYYLTKELGVNSLGGTVPVYRYTTMMPESYKPAIKEIEALQARLDAVTKAHTDTSSRF